MLMAADLVSKVLEVLGGRMGSDGSATVRCPAHDDRNPSLNIKADGNKLLVHCYAGCSQAAVISALRDRGLWPGKTAQHTDTSYAVSAPLRPKAPATPETLTATYIYRDADSKELFQVHRHEAAGYDKTFRQWVVDPKNGNKTAPKQAGVQLVPYNLPDVLTVDQIALVEGEKDADCLISKGLVATTTPMGASNWKPEYAKHFDGKHLVIIPDRDKPGQGYRDAVIKDCLGVAASLRVVDLPFGKDVSEYLDGGGSIEQIREMIQAAPEAAQPGNDEPIPLPDDLPSVQPFDYDLLPDTLRPWIQDISDRMQCPPDFVAVAALGSIAAVLGRKAGIRPQARTDWTVVPNLWILVVGRPGVLKSPALEAGLSPLKRLIAEANDTYHMAEEQYKVEALTAKLKKEAAEKTARAMLAKDPEADLSAVLAVDGEPASPVLKRYQANDCTPASLGELLRQNPNGLLVFRDEVVSLLKSLDRDGQDEGRGFYLTAWNGDSPYTFDRIGRGLNLTIPAICLSVLGGTQPGRLSEYIYHAVKGGAADDGLIQRFGIMVWPDIPQKWKNVDRTPDRDAKNQAYEVFAYLDKLSPDDIQAEQDIDINGQPDGIPYLRFEPAALEVFTEWRSDLEQKLRSDDMLPALESHFSKYRKLIPSLALIFHLVDGGTGPVTETATLRALAWSQYLESHAYRAYGSITSPEISTAKAILKKIQKGNLLTPFVSRDVWRPGWSKLTDRGQVAKGLQVLEDYGWIEPEEIPTGGRPRTIYHYKGEPT